MFPSRSDGNTYKQCQVMQVEHLRDEHPSSQRTACKQSPPQHPSDTCYPSLSLKPGPHSLRQELGYLECLVIYLRDSYIEGKMCAVF